MCPDAALARGDEVLRHSEQPSESREDGCSARLHETEGKDHFLKSTVPLTSMFRAVLNPASCHLVQELELLDKNNSPLTHAKYNREKVKEAGDRERRPHPIEVPQYLEEHLRGYFAEVSLHLM